MSALTIGVDIGGTKVLGGVVDPDGLVLATARRDTPADDVAKTRDLVVEVIEELAGRHRVAAVGIGVAGWIDADRSRVLFAPNLAFRDEPLRDRIAERVGVPVVVDNDGNTAAWAEFRFGAAREAHSSMALVTVGTGIGGGIVVGGELLRGNDGLAAEPGHMTAQPDGRPCPCGRRGCLEQYASGSALVRAARDGARSGPAGAARLLELAGGSPDAIAGPIVTEAARAGDPVALAAFAELGRWLAVGLADLMFLLDPEVMVLGGGVSDAGDLLLAPTQVALDGRLGARGRLPRAPLVAARLGNQAGLVGAADLARR